MAGVIEEFVSGVVSSALKEVLNKSGVRGTKTRRTRRRTSKTKSGGILADIVEAALKPKPARKQVSRRRTAAARSKQRSRA